MTEIVSSEKVLTVKDVARHLACENDLVYSLVSQGKLRAIRVGRLIRVPQSALDEFIAGTDSDIQKFLLNRIAEDEEVLQVFLDDWIAAGAEEDTLRADDDFYPSTEYTEIGVGAGRFAAEIEAKKKIIAEGNSSALRALAKIYAFHTDYHIEWEAASNDEPR